jgi:hypothetical protein
MNGPRRIGWTTEVHTQGQRAMPETVGTQHAHRTMLTRAPIRDFLSSGRRWALLLVAASSFGCAAPSEEEIDEGTGAATETSGGSEEVKDVRFDLCATTPEGASGEVVESRRAARDPLPPEDSEG